MTTYAHRPTIVTATIPNQPEHTGAYTVTTYVTGTDHTPLRLTFHADRITGPHAAAEAAFQVGNHRRPDDTGQRWPDSARQLSVGDVLTVTAPDGTTTHLTTDPRGFAEIELGDHADTHHHARAAEHPAPVRESS